MKSISAIFDIYVDVIRKIKLHNYDGCVDKVQSGLLRCS